jgi:hypothetical protein
MINKNAMQIIEGKRLGSTGHKEKGRRAAKSERAKMIVIH